MSDTRVMKGLPNEEEADMAMGLYESEDPAPTSVTKKQEANGTWTVTAVFD